MLVGGWLAGGWDAFDSGVAQRHCNCVGGVDGLQLFLEFQLSSDHTFDLLFVGVSVAGDGQLDFVRTVFPHITPGSSSGRHDDPTCVTDRHSSTHIHLEQHPFDGDHPGLVFVDELDDLALQDGETLRQFGGVIGADDTGGHSHEPTWALPVDTAVAAPCETGVDSENEHAYDTTRGLGRCGRYDPRMPLAIGYRNHVSETTTNIEPSVDQPSDATGAGAERVFSKSVVISGIRCVLTYVIFPFVAPLVGLTSDTGAVVGVIIGIVAIVFNVLSIRRFFAADHPYKWWASALNAAVIVLLVVLFVIDSQTLLG